MRGAENGAVLAQSYYILPELSQFYLHPKSSISATPNLPLYESLLSSTARLHFQREYSPAVERH